MQKIPGKPQFPTNGEYDAAADAIIQEVQRRKSMHYRNGREAKNGDKVVQLTLDGKLQVIGVLYDATPGNDFCNGMLAQIPVTGHAGACICDCLHVDDLAELLKQAGLDKRPAGK